MTNKHQLASQLENIMQVSHTTISNLEKEKRSLLDERSLLQDQVLAIFIIHVNIEVYPCH